MIRPLEPHVKTVNELERFLSLPESAVSATFTGITADSRAVEPGDLFIAARGPLDSRHLQ